MKTGMNLLLWTTHVTSEHFPLLAKLKKAGFDGVEIPLFEGDAAHYKTIRKELDNHGLGCTTVTVVSAGGQPDQPRRRDPPGGASSDIKWAIEMTAILGGENLCGPYHSPLAVFSGHRADRGREEPRPPTCSAQAAEFAQQHKVMLAIEYLNRFECYFLTTAADARALVQAVNHPHFRTMYDTFHANIEEKNAGAGDQATGRALRPRPHQRERPRHARHRHGPLGRDVPGAARGQVRRLAGHRGVRPGAARPGRRDARSGATCSPAPRRSTRRGCGS